MTDMNRGFLPAINPVLLASKAGKELGKIQKSFPAGFPSAGATRTQYELTIHPQENCRAVCEQIQKNSPNPPLPREGNKTRISSSRVNAGGISPRGVQPQRDFPPGAQPSFHLQKNCRIG
jgi:hypothetical protein